MASSNFNALGSIRLISWNIKGILHPIKRSPVFAHLKSLNPEIIFLQETHLRINEQARLERGWIEQIFCSKYEDRSRGTAILIKKGIPFVPTKVISDDKGRYIIVAGKLFSSQIVLANVYGPNWDNPVFLPSDS